MRVRILNIGRKTWGIKCNEIQDNGSLKMKKRTLVYWKYELNEKVLMDSYNKCGTLISSVVESN